MPRERQAPSPASVRLDADERDDYAPWQIPRNVTPEEPALQARAPAFPANIAFPK